MMNVMEIALNGNCALFFFFFLIRNHTRSLRSLDF